MFSESTLHGRRNIASPAVACECRAMRWFAATLWWIACLGATARAQVVTKSPPPPEAKELVFIVAVSPTSFVDGVQTEVEVTVAYDLQAKPEALIEIGSNTTRPHAFSPFASQRVEQGSGTIIVRGKFTPRFWTSNVVPRISAHLVVSGEQVTQRKSLASDQKAFALALRPNPSATYSVNPSPSVVYEDGLRIKSIRPAQLVEGQPVDIEVVVSYELLSREVGEMTLGFSSRPNAYAAVDRQQVKIGKGEIVLRGRVVPRRTGSLPFAKLQVSLLEFPKRLPSAVLALEAETVEVSARP